MASGARGPGSARAGAPTPCAGDAGVSCKPRMVTPGKACNCPTVAACAEEGMVSSAFVGSVMPVGCPMAETPSGSRVCTCTPWGSRVGTCTPCGRRLGICVPWGTAGISPKRPATAESSNPWALAKASRLCISGTGASLVMTLMVCPKGIICKLPSPSCAAASPCRSSFSMCPVKSSAKRPPAPLSAPVGAAFASVNPAPTRADTGLAEAEKFNWVVTLRFLFELPKLGIHPNLSKKRDR